MFWMSATTHQCISLRMIAYCIPRFKVNQENIVSGKNYLNNLIFRTESIKIIDKAEICKELQDDFSTKANSTLDSMRPDSAKSE